MTYQYPQQPPAPPRRKRKSNTLLIVLVSIMGVLVLCVGVAAVWGVTHDDKPSNDSTPAPATSSSPAPDPSLAVPGRDIGAGTPGAACSTDRLGKYFVKDGVTYTCKGPAPYKWRE